MGKLMLNDVNYSGSGGGSGEVNTIESISLNGTPLTPDANKNVEITTSGKADKVSGATNGNFAGLDSNGNLTDSGSKASDFLTQHQDITGKADKVASATSGNFAGLDANGNLTDSGKKASDFATVDNNNTNIQFVKNAVGFSGKNLLPSFGIGMSSNGVTMTVDENGVCTFNGTATTATAFMVCSKTQLKEIVDKLKGRTVYCTGLPDNVPNNCRIEFQGLVTDGVSTQVTSATPKQKITISDYTNFNTMSVGIIITKDTVCDNLKFYPMMYDEDVLDDTYEPFSYTIKERLAEQNVLGVKNFIPFPYHDGTSKEINGITYTVNADGTILANGTATGGDANFALSTYSESEIPEGRFYLSDEAGFNIAEGNRAYLCMARRKNGGTINYDYDTSMYSSHKRQVVVDYSQYNEFNFFIYVMNGTTLDNVVFKPMLRYATYADDTYVQPIWTNKQLTNKKMSTSTYDPTGAVATAGGIVQYINDTVTSALSASY